MDMKTYLKQATQEEREALAEKVDSSVAYFYQIAGGHKKPGTELCKKLVCEEPKLTLEELRPDVWADVPSVCASSRGERRKSPGRRSTDKSG